MRVFLTTLLALVAVALGTTLAEARPPRDLADLVGARGSSGEMALQSRGYNFDHAHGLTAYWWNGRICVSVRTSNGRYVQIDRESNDHCVSRPAGGSGDKPAAGGGNGNVPQAASRACRRSADDYQGVVPGTSSVVGATRSGGNWVLKMSSGGTFKSTCTVASNGRIIDMSPGY